MTSPSAIGGIRVLVKRRGKKYTEISREPYRILVPHDIAHEVADLLVDAAERGESWSSRP
ncbi:MAG: hypothetical protein WAW17_27955 [Rhodococcus sp. (in: high G+C Gram-positive bacteria)]|uniref:hypothetical protein n=1 Tax=Rhodococcus sp. TaxID=1831 RepID=UPI003BAF1AB8